MFGNLMGTIFGHQGKGPKQEKGMDTTDNYCRQISLIAPIVESLLDKISRNLFLNELNEPKYRKSTNEECLLLHR